MAIKIASVVHDHGRISCGSDESDGVLCSPKNCLDRAFECGRIDGALKVPTDAELKAILDPAGKEALATLNGLNGTGFDKAYVAAQLDGHKKLLAIQEDSLKV